MDLITVDVTNVDVQEGDQVEVFGNNITISEIAEKLDTIPYEILTGVSRRVKRVYYQE
jgi:alanine racemase